MFQGRQVGELIETLQSCNSTFDSIVNDTTSASIIDNCVLRLGTMQVILILLDVLKGETVLSGTMDRSYSLYAMVCVEGAGTIIISKGQQEHLPTSKSVSLA